MIEQTGRRRSALFPNMYLCYLCFLIIRISPLSLLPSGAVQQATGINEHASQNKRQELMKLETGMSQGPAIPTDREMSSTDVSCGQRWHASDTFSTLIDALSIMQLNYFHIWPGTWPSAIDWTAAVMGTQISATLSTITESLGCTTNQIREGSTIKFQQTQSYENMINQYFTQIASFYHGENAFSLRTQAYDDMLWVVLGWLESVKFINLHSKLHYAGPVSDSTNEVNTSKWYAQQFIPQFAHRACVFYDLASHGWDTSLCGGGMVWNPYLAPYKNAITNQLFMAASVAMYLYFPGDDNPSPFRSSRFGADDSVPPAKAHDARYLENAVKAYDWLKQSNMTNSQGLYIDGFHIRNWRGGHNSSHGTGECDVRDEKVYTYNQGVILSGLRGLWDATSSLSYLQDGHQLIRNVIKATGWDDDTPLRRYRWAGMGRNGVMEEACDSSGVCSQDGQTFKGIWWHHFSIFCAPLLRTEHGQTEGRKGEEEAMVLHRKSCEGYGEWVRWNANAAQEARNDDGEYGTWWGKHPWPWAEEERTDEGTDYRNRGVPDDEVWRLPEDDSILQGTGQPTVVGIQVLEEPTSLSDQQTLDAEHRAKSPWDDPNSRGRGRTVETQSGGLAVMRALFNWEMWYMDMS